MFARNYLFFYNVLKMLAQKLYLLMECLISETFYVDVHITLFKCYNLFWRTFKSNIPVICAKLQNEIFT